MVDALRLFLWWTLLRGVESGNRASSHEGDLGHLVARRANYRKDNLEAPEIIYNPDLKKYYLFTSYDPLMTTYNVRVSRSDAAEGPFTDYFGKAEKDTTNNFPILTAPYRFENHPGWAGTAHCGVFTDGQGNYFMAHQGRLSPQNQLMVLHVRQLFLHRMDGRSFLPKDMRGLLHANSPKPIW